MNTFEPAKQTEQSGLDKRTGQTYRRTRTLTWYVRDRAGVIICETANKWSAQNVCTELNKYQQ